MLTYPKSTMRVRRIPMHLSSGHVTLMPGKFYPPPPNFPQSDLGRRADSRWPLPQISSYLYCSIELQHKTAACLQIFIKQRLSDMKNMCVSLVIITCI